MKLFFLRKKSETAEVSKSKKVDKNQKKRVGFLTNLRIASKLFLGFFIIALLGAGMGVFASINLDKASASNTKMYEEMLLPQRNITNLISKFQDTRVNFRNMIVMDKAAVERTLPGFNSMLSWLISGVDSFETLMSQDSKGLIQNFKTAIEAYNQEVNLAIEGIKAGKQEEIINDLLNGGELYKIEKDVTSALEKLNTATTETANAQQMQINKDAANVKLITYIVIGLEIIISTIIAVIIAHGISKPVKKLTNGLNLLAAGETNIPSMGIKSKDEIGQMRNAFRSIIESIKLLDEDTQMLIEAATEGQLSVRADVGKHQGSYRRIIEGFNATLDAVTMPINEAAAVLSEVSQGNLDTCVTGDLKGDYTIIKSSLNETIQILKGYIREISAVLGEIADGNVNVEIVTEYRGDFTQLKNSINKIAVSLNNMLCDIGNASAQMSIGTQQLSEGSQVISQGASDQADAIVELSASLTQIADQTNQNAQRAGHANELARRVQNTAIMGDSDMKEMQKAMEEINASSENISKIIKVIDDIAFQTNILALNAAVEAARAGVYGKGFAVVAEEVRNLAARSAEAVKDTSELIEGSLKKVKTGTKIADKTAQALDQIVKGVEDAAKLVGDIAVASNEQALGIQQINRSIEQLSVVVQSNSATAQEAAAASEEVSSQSEMLKSMVDQFRLKERAFEEGSMVAGEVANDKLLKTSLGEYGGKY